MNLVPETKEINNLKGKLRQLQPQAEFAITCSLTKPGSPNISPRVIGALPAYGFPLSEPKNATVARQWEWRTGRTVLAQTLIKLLGAQDSSAAMAYRKQISLSLTHAAGLCLAGGLYAPVGSVLGFGIDCELSNQLVPRDALQKVSSEGERRFMNLHDLSALEVWTIKEACVKACGRNISALMERIEVQSYCPFQKRGWAKGYERRFDFVLHNSYPWLVTAAVSNNMDDKLLN